MAEDPAKKAPLAEEDAEEPVSIHGETDRKWPLGLVLLTLIIIAAIVIVWAFWHVFSKGSSSSTLPPVSNSSIY